MRFKENIQAEIIAKLFNNRMFAWIKSTFEKLKENLKMK